jgi:hypothetical protein
MSTHYLIDANTPILANSEINDVRYAPEDVVLGGNFCIPLPDGISIGPTDPTDLTDLLTKKYAGLLAAHPLYTNIAFESFISAPSVDLANSSLLAVGDRCTTKFLSDTSVYRSVMTGLASSPTQAVVIFDMFFSGGPNPAGDRATRLFEVVPSTTFGTLEVSFDNGVTWLTTTTGALLNIPVPSQGSFFILRFTGTSTKDFGLGSWAVIY